MSKREDAMTRKNYFSMLVWLVVFVVPLTMGGTERPSQAQDTSHRANISPMVLVMTDKQEYQQDEEIVVTITNNLDTRITTFDQQAFCTIVRLDERVGEEWKEVRNCLSGAPPRFLTIDAQAETYVKLPGLSQGVYRASVVFSQGDTFNFGDSYISSSTPFKVL
jgi:hypothetical protein